MGYSAENEDSYSYSNELYLVFTRGLISGLENLKADMDADGILTASEWFEFASLDTLERDLNQHPVFLGNGDLVITDIHGVPIPGSGTVLLSAFLILRSFIE